MRLNKNPELNKKILDEKLAQYNKIEGPRVGDWIRLPNGSYARLAEVNDSFFQCGVGSFHLYGESCDFSGSFHHDCPPVSILIQTAETRLGRIWFFNGNDVRADNGVDFDIECRVFTIREDARDSGSFGDWDKFIKRLSGDT